MGPLLALLTSATFFFSPELAPLVLLLIVVGYVAVADWRRGVRPLDRVRREEIDADLVPASRRPPVD